MRRRSGFTLLELLVVIVIIGILLALILPAIMHARAAARRTQCTSNLHQLAIAAANFESVHQRLPNSGTFGVTTASNGTRVIDYFQPKRSWVVDLLPYMDCKNLHDGWTFTDPNPADALLVDHPNWNVASPATCATDSVDGIAGVAISASEIDPRQRDNAATSHQYIPLLVCPDEPTSLSQGGGLSYVCNSGYGEFDGTFADTNCSNNWSCTQIDWDGDGLNCAVTALTDPDDAQIARMTGLFWAGSEGAPRAVDDVRIKLASVIDGYSSTIMFTENTNAGFARSGDPAGSHGDYTWAMPWTLATGFVVTTVDICPNGQFGVCNDPRQDLAYQSANAPAAVGRINRDAGRNEGRAPFPSSYHHGVVIVAFCDGSTRSLSAAIDGSVYCRLLSPQGSLLPTGSQFNSARTDEGLWQGPVSDNDF
jgi:prepilin-type N-terminal cleavage/methylation domain-containing protein